MVKDKKYSIKDKMSIKISFMHYMKSTRVMLFSLPLVFKEFEMVDIFATFFCSLSLSIDKRLTLAKV